MKKSVLIIGVVAFGMLASASISPANLLLAQNRDAMIVRYLPPESDSDKRMMYYIEMLKLALDKTIDSHGNYKMEPAAKAMSQVEAMKYLIAGEQLDVLHSMTDRGRERVLRPVRIPLDKGLIGLRLLMVNKEDELKFAAVKSENDLAKFNLGQGADWPDTEILKANKLKVTTSPTYPALFDMLKAKQIDAFPRAVFEIFEEIDQRRESNFVVAQGILIQYPAAMYFFVRQSNQVLAERLDTGLRRAINDGSFETLFNKYLKNDLEKAALPMRTRIQLKNSLLPENTPLSDKKLWHM